MSFLSVISFFVKYKTQMIYLLGLLALGSIAYSVYNHYHNIEIERNNLKTENTNLNLTVNSLQQQIDTLQSLSQLRDVQNKETTKLVTQQNTIREIIRNVPSSPIFENKSAKPFDDSGLFDAARQLRTYQSNTTDSSNSNNKR